MFILWFNVLVVVEVVLSAFLLMCVFLPPFHFHVHGWGEGEVLGVESFNGCEVNVFVLLNLLLNGVMMMVLLYATQTKPLPLVGQISFLCVYFPYFVVVGVLYVLTNSIEVQHSFQATCVVWTFFLAWVLSQYFEEKGWRGVPTTPLIGSLPALLANTHRRPLFEYEMINQYGPATCVRLGDTRAVYLSDPLDVEYILKTNQKNFEIGYRRRLFSYDLLGDGIFNVDGHMWFQQRKSASKEFSVTRFRDFMLVVFANYAHLVVDRLDKIAGTNEVINLQDLFFRYTFDSFGYLAFGVEVGCLEKGEVPPFAHAFDRANAITSYRFSDPFWTLKRLFSIGTEKELAEHIRTIDDFVNPIIQNRKKLSNDELDEKCDFLSRFMALKDENGTSPSDKYLRDLVVNFMLAGRDTTASGLSWTMFEMTQHPEVVEKARKEIFSVIGETHATDDIIKPSFEQLRDMHYLNAIFSESLRLHPPVPADGKVTREDDVLPSGVPVKAGYIAIFHPYAMGRSAALWTDPLTFAPERWLDENGKFKRESPYKFAVFQAGPRQCLGIDFAYLEAKLILVMLLQRYDVTFAMNVNDVRVASPSMTMSIATGLPIRVTKRK